MSTDAPSRGIAESAVGGAALGVEGLRVAYGDLTAVWDVSLEVRPGRITALVGRNGAGKTTLLSGIAGLLPARSGRVELDGRDITGLAPWRRVDAGMSLVQEGKRVFRGLSVQDNLEIGVLGRRHHGLKGGGQITELFDRFPLLADRRKELAGSLSGGQQQMLAIATALAPHPRVLLVDEPSSGLAPVVVDQIFDILVELRNDGMAILLVEQLVEEVLDGTADDVIVLEQGRVSLTGDASDVTVEDILAGIYPV